LLTACSGIIGAFFALLSSSAEQAGDVTSWILPFSSGGFLYISMANILPEIIAERNLVISIKQILSMTLGIFVIYWFSIMFE
jgi:zinc transporter 13